MGIETIGPVTITVLEGELTASTTITKNAWLESVFFKCPTLADAKTATLQIIDADNYVIYEDTGIGTGATSGEDATSLWRELYGTVTLKVTITGTQTGNKAFEVKMTTRMVSG